MLKNQVLIPDDSTWQSDEILKKVLYWVQAPKQYFIPVNRYKLLIPDTFGLYGQVTKRARWMPWQSEAMKDVVACEKLRGGGKQPLIRRSLNGETHPTCWVSLSWIHRVWRRTRGTETSKYPEEKKSTEIPSVAASERGPALKPHKR